VIEKAKQNYRENVDERKAYIKQWRERNPELVEKYKATSQSTHNQRQKAWRALNPENVKASSANRRARRVGNGGQHTPDDIKAIYAMQRGMCACCGIKLNGKYHVDHIYPLVAGGSNDRLNLQIACATCNLKKNSKDPIDFMQSMGKLL
jgi:5-methylcytosine-specific restriction endonuclease McrA